MLHAEAPKSFLKGCQNVKLTVQDVSAEISPPESEFLN